MKRRIPMKAAKRTLSILLALLMLASCLAIGTSADGSNVLTQPEWNSYWETVRNDNTLIALTPGADATQLNFCWHSDDTAKSGVVRIGKSADMTSFKMILAGCPIAPNCGLPTIHPPKTELWFCPLLLRISPC